MSYAIPPGGLPEQGAALTGKAIFTTAYAFIPAGVQRDIVTSFLPHWRGMRMWVLARPLSGFAETFSHYIVELEAGGGSERPEDDAQAQAVLFVVQGTLTLHNADGRHQMAPGGYAYIPAGQGWRVENTGDRPCKFHWVRKKYQAVEGLPSPETFVTSDQDTAPTPMTNTDLWSTTRFVEPDDLRHDFHVNLVNFQPGGMIPFEETHVMEHGLYVLEGTARYLLNTDWVEVGPGDYMWLRAFCPQACETTGDGPFRYLLYKDVNRHAAL